MAQENAVENEKIVEVVEDVEAKEEKSVYMTITEVAEYLGLDYFHCYHLLNNDEKMSYFKYGRKKMWLRTDIENFKNEHTFQPKIIRGEE